MRDYLKTASPETLAKLGRLNGDELEAALEMCDRLMSHIEDARDNLATDEYRELLQWVTTDLRIKALPEVEH